VTNYKVQGAGKRL